VYGEDHSPSLATPSGTFQKHFVCTTRNRGAEKAGISVPAERESPVIVNTARITLKPGKQKEFLQTVTQLLELIKAAKGCVSFHVYVDAVDENSSLLVSEWETEADLNRHFGSDDFAVLRGAVAALCISAHESTALVYAGGRQNSPSSAANRDVVQLRSITR
jgi:quinol monooxygenase YgiN